MSVDSYYFCSNLELGKTWWNQPVSETALALKSWRISDDRDQLGLFDQHAVEEDLVPALDQIADKLSTHQSMSDVFRLKLEALYEPAGKKKRSFFNRSKSGRKSGLDEKSMNELAYLGSFHSAFAQVGRKGPVTETADTKVTDTYFAQFVGRYLSAEEAAKYNGSDTSNLLGPYLPPELMDSELPVVETLIMRLEKPYLVDAGEWLKNRQILDHLQGFWDQFEAEQTSVKSIRHLHAIKGVARYVLENNLAMLKMFT